MWLQVLLVGAGGAVGSVSRFLLSGAAQRLSGSLYFPYGTLAVNLLGGFLLGLVMEVARPGVVSPQVRLLLTMGFFGGFTTFSTYTYESVRLIEDGEHLLALTNLLGSVVLGVMLTWLGLLVGRMLLQ